MLPLHWIQFTSFHTATPIPVLVENEFYPNAHFWYKRCMTNRFSAPNSGGHHKRTIKLSLLDFSDALPALLVVYKLKMSNSESSYEKDSTPPGSSNDAVSQREQEAENCPVSAKGVTVPHTTPVNIRATVSVKVSYMRKNSKSPVLFRRHRVCVSTTLSFREMEALLLTLGNLNCHINLTYEDDDKDRIDVFSDKDMYEMFSVASRIHPRALRMTGTYF